MPRDPNYCYQAEEVRWPWLPGAQNYLHYYPHFARILREVRPDIIDLWEEPWGLVSAHACWLRDRVLPTARILSETEQNLNKKLPPPFEHFRRYVLRKADYLIGRSREAVEVARIKGYAGPARVVGNGVDPALFFPRDREACRSRLFPDWGAQEFLAIYVGRLVAEKGVEEMIHALQFAPPSVRLAFIGSGPMDSVIRAEASRKGVTDRIRLIPACPPQALVDYMAAADALILMSRTTQRWKEQFGRVIIEAQACGTPVIGSSSGAIPEVVGTGGLVVPEGDPKELGQALNRLVGESGLIEKLRGAALANARRFTWERIGVEMSSVYAELSKPRSPN